MDVLGIDISKLKFDVVLIIGERSKHAMFSNTEAGFQQLLAWLVRQRPDPARSLHACMEATGNWGLDLADLGTDRCQLRDAVARVNARK